MAPTFPPSFRASGRRAAAAIAISSSSSSGWHAADPITISSSSGKHAADAITISSSGPGPAPRKVVVVLSSSPAAVPILPVSSPSDGGGGGGDEATSRRKRKARYRCWDIDDELKVLRTMAKLRKENLDELPPASWLFEALDGGRALRQRGVHVTELSQKVYHLKNKFRKAAAKSAANGGRRPAMYRNRELYEISKEVWPDLLEAAAAAAP